MSLEHAIELLEKKMSLERAIEFLKQAEAAICFPFEPETNEIEFEVWSLIVQARCEAEFVKQRNDEKAQAEYEAASKYAELSACHLP